MAQLFLCVDGGGSKTEALLADTEGHVFGRGIAAGSNALSVGKKQAIAAVMDACSQALQGFSWFDIARVQLFIPGFSSCLPLPVETQVFLSSDAENAYFGALAQPGGIAILAGTGSFAVHIDAGGHATAVGGWGPMLGDEGSGYDIGKMAVQHALARYDAGNPPDTLSRAVLDHYNIDNAAHLVHQVYHGGCDRALMAALCPTVGTLAQKGDWVSIRLLEKAAASLADLAKKLQARLDLGCVPVAILGGAAKLGNVLQDPLRRELENAGLQLCTPRCSPAVGGAIAGCFRLIGATPDEDTVHRYQTSYENIVKGEKCNDA